jgi:hypothetical protein
MSKCPVMPALEEDGECAQYTAESAKVLHSRFRYATVCRSRIEKLSYIRNFQVSAVG